METVRKGPGPGPGPGPGRAGTRTKTSGNSGSSTGAAKKIQKTDIISHKDSGCSTCPRLSSETGDYWVQCSFAQQPLLTKHNSLWSNMISARNDPTHTCDGSSSRGDVWDRSGMDKRILCLGLRGGQGTPEEQDVRLWKGGGKVTISKDNDSLAESDPLCTQTPAIHICSCHPAWKQNHPFIWHIVSKTWSLSFKPKGAYS